jgi:uncharacterized protein YdhG (YjbR/CyaY superfamily)
MTPRRTAPATVDEYIAGFPSDVQALLKKVRSTILKAAPGAEESISYQIPAFKSNGVLVYFAAFKQHISLYPAPRGNAAFKKELAVYAGGKGTVRFPLDRPIPLDLIRRIVRFRAEQNAATAGTKPARKRGARG